MRWPCDSCAREALPSASLSTTPICDRRRARAAGPLTKRSRGSQPAGRALDCRQRPEGAPADRAPVRRAAPTGPRRGRRRGRSRSPARRRWNRSPAASSRPVRPPGCRTAPWPRPRGGPAPIRPRDGGRRRRGPFRRRRYGPRAAFSRSTRACSAVAAASSWRASRGLDLGPADGLFLEGLALVLDLGGPAGEILGAPFLILDGAGQAAPPRLLGGDPLGQLGVALVQALDDLAGRLQLGGGLLAGCLLALAGGGDAGRFVFQVAGRRRRVLGQRLLARDVGGDLLQPRLAAPLRLGDPGLLGFQAVAGQGQALQFGRGLGLGLAQRRDAAGPFGLQGRGLGGDAGEAGDGGLDLAQVLALGGEVGLGGGPAQSGTGSPRPGGYGR